MRCKHIRFSKVAGIIAGVLITLFTLGFEGSFSPTWAVECGDTIGPGQTVVLDHSIACDVDPILTVVGPAILNLNGFTLACVEQNNDGILVTGERAVIFRGMIENCNRGIHVRGDGHHKLKDLTLDQNDHGIRVRSGSDKNYMIKNTVLNGNRGIRVESDYNHLINNFAELNSKGIRIEGEYNKLVGNEADDNSSENFQIKGSHNRLVNNTADGGDEECFLIEGDNNSLVNNSARDCAYGFVLSDEDGAGDNNTILNCKAIDNGIDGIVARDGATDNSITHNKAWDNAAFDLHDENANCDDNVWRWNKFGSSQPDDCIR